MEKVINDRFASLLRDRWVEARLFLKKPPPLILHEEVYEYFGEWCQIIEANVYDTISNAQVVIESRGGDRAQVEFSELRWRRNMDIADAFSKKPMEKIILDGP